MNERVASRSRVAPMLGAAMILAFAGGVARALSLRASSAETAVREGGALLRVENTGKDPVRVEFAASTPPPETCKDGYEPWPFPKDVRLEILRADAKPGQAAEAKLTVGAPKGAAAEDGQYEVEVLATGRDAAGLALPVRTRALIPVGAPLALESDAATEEAEFDVTPKSSAGTEAEVKLINAGADDATVSIKPAGTWSGAVRFQEGDEPAPNPRWLRTDAAALKVKAGGIGRARIWAAIPREKRYAGRRFAFVAAADAVAGGRRMRRYFVLRVVTPDWKEDQRAR